MKSSVGVNVLGIVFCVCVHARVRREVCVMLWIVCPCVYVKLCVCVWLNQGVTHSHTHTDARAHTYTDARAHTYTGKQTNRVSVCICVNVRVSAGRVCTCVRACVRASPPWRQINHGGRLRKWCVTTIVGAKNELLTRLKFGFVCKHCQQTQ